jgi:hypothetical protein
VEVEIIESCHERERAQCSTIRTAPHFSFSLPTWKRLHVEGEAMQAKGRVAQSGRTSSGKRRKATVDAVEAVDDDGLDRGDQSATSVTGFEVVVTDWS